MHKVNVATVTKDNDGYEVATLGSVTADTGNSPWMSEIKVDNYDIVFKIDTGADASAVPETLYTKSQFSKLGRAKMILKGPGRTPQGKRHVLSHSQ